MMPHSPLFVPCCTWETADEKHSLLQNGSCLRSSLPICGSNLKSNGKVSCQSIINLKLHDANDFSARDFGILAQHGSQ